MSGIRRLTIAGETDVARAALEATQYSLDAGFEQTPALLIATAVSELARNIFKYAHSGEIVLSIVDGPQGCGIQVVANDEGPGIPDTQAAMRDHFSSSGTLGLGLPGVKRLMDEFSLESVLGEGTCVTAIKWK